MTRDETKRAARVTGPTQPKQAADICDRWGWVEHSVWTERMLTRLEQSEPTTVWYGLWDKVLAARNLQAAFWSVWRNDGAPGADGQTVKQFDAQAEAQLARLREELRNKRYRRQPARRTNGRSLSEIVAKVNPILRGWHGYFRGSYRTGLSGPDGWLRRRLRALLRQREKRPGYGLSEADSRRWPNRWFAARGLYSLEHGTCAYG